MAGGPQPVAALLAELEPADRDGVRLTGLTLRPTTGRPTGAGELMGPTRKRDLTAAVVGAAVVGYLLVTVLYRWFPPITVWTGLSLLAVAVAEAAVGALRAGQDQRRRNRRRARAGCTRSRWRAAWWSPRPRRGWARWCWAGGSACWCICCRAGRLVAGRRRGHPAPWWPPSARWRWWSPRCGCSIAANRRRIRPSGPGDGDAGALVRDNPGANRRSARDTRNDLARYSQAMTVLSRGARVRRGGRRPGWLLLTALLVLAIGASSALVFTNRVELLKLAVILALWAAVAGGVRVGDLPPAKRCRPGPGA